MKMQVAQWPGWWLTIAMSAWFAMAASGQDRNTSFSFDHLTVDDGLSYSTVHDLLEDDLGMIWVGTRFGLNRFDGYQFKVFLPDASDPYAIKGQSILCLHNDDQGNIWIGHLNGGVSVLERKTGRFLRFPFSENNTLDWNTVSVRSIFRDTDGNTWLGTYGAGVIVFDSSYHEVAHLCTTCPGSSQLPNDFVFDFLSDEAGRTWIGTAGNSIAVYHPDTKEITTIHGTVETAMEGFAKSLCSGEGKTIWLGTEGSGLYEIDPKAMRIVRHIAEADGLSSPMITDVLPDRNGNLWIATDGGGLNRFTPSTNEWQHFSYQPDFLNSLNSDALYDLMLDRAGNLWIGTFNGGINLHKSIFPPFVIDRQYAKENAAGLRSVLSVDQDEAGTVYLGTDGGGLCKLLPDEKPIEIYALEKTAAHPPGVKVITSVVVAEHGDLWLGSFAQGLFRYHEQRGIIQHFQHHPLDTRSLSHNNVWDIEPDQDGGLWIATLGGGVCYLPPGANDFERYMPETGNEQSLSGTQIIDVLLDERRQCVWAASENAGLSRIDLAGAVKRITRFNHHPKLKDGIGSDALRCLFQDAEGTLWIGTENAGLSALRIGAADFIHFTMADGLPSNMINSIAQASDGALWITTQGGIVRKTSTDHFVKIGAEPFLKNNQYNPRAATVLHDGRIIFGSTNGYSILLPEQVPGNSIPPAVVFTGLSISNEEIPIGNYRGRTMLTGPLNDAHSQINLSYQDKGIRIDFTTTDLVQADKNQFAYRLVGFDTTWRYVGPDQRFATFSALPGGSYLLQVKASNAGGAWSSAPRSIRIVVKPPFWTTWWFITTSILASMVAVSAGVKFLLDRQRSHYQQQALEAEQEILRLQNESLEKDIRSKQAQLNASVLQSAHKNQFLEDLKSQIHRIEGHETNGHARELHRLTRSIDHELTQKDYWDQFQLTFNQVHQDFVHKLQSGHPEISATESRLCCFIRMGFSNAEIAAILNITVNGVEQSKYRLKKKLALDRDANLNAYIMGL